MERLLEKLDGEMIFSQLLLLNALLGQPQGTESKPINFYGTVVDSKTGVPIYGANVLLNGTLLGSITDSTGKFSIINVPPGNYTIKISCIGYSTLEYNSMPLYSSDSVLFRLQYTAFEYLPQKIDCHSIIEKACQDTMLGNIFIMMSGGFAGIPNDTASLRWRSELWSRFHISLAYTGCSFNECYNSHNEIIYEYLDNRYDKSWRSVFSRSSLK